MTAPNTQILTFSYLKELGLFGEMVDNRVGTWYTCNIILYQNEKKWQKTYRGRSKGTEARLKGHTQIRYDNVL